MKESKAARLLRKYDEKAAADFRTKVFTTCAANGQQTVRCTITEKNPEKGWLSK